MTGRKYSSFKWQQRSPRPPLHPTDEKSKERVFGIKVTSTSQKAKNKPAPAAKKKSAS